MTQIAECKFVEKRADATDKLTCVRNWILACLLTVNICSVWQEASNVEKITHRIHSSEAEII